MRVAVIGAGAVGGVLGARLAAAGHDVWFVVRPATAELLARGGIRLDSCDGDLHLPEVQVTTEAASLGAVDVVLVCVKSTQVAAIAPSLRPLLAPHTLVIPTQNGVEAGVQLASVLGDAHVSDGVCRVIAGLVAPGHVHHMAVTPILEYGSRAGAPTAPDGQTLSPPVQATAARFAAAMAGAGMRAVIPPDMGVALWEKFLFIEPIGLVGAVTRQPYGVIRSVAETRALLDEALEEVLAVGRAVGVRWPADAKATIWARYDALLPEGYTSMARDLIAGRPSEYDGQTGAVIRLARAHGVPVPVHTHLHAVLVPSAISAG